MDVPAPQPDPAGPFTVERSFALVAEGGREGCIGLVAFPDLTVGADDLLPRSAG